MLTEPKIETRKEQSYAAIRTKVSMKDIPAVLPPLIPDILNWIKKNNIVQTGPAFFRYLSWDKPNEFIVDVGVPVEKPIKPDSRVIAGSFPGGSYAVITHFGDYKNLKGAHMSLEDWVRKNHLNEKKQASANGDAYGVRTEFYTTDPDVEKDIEKWETEIAFFLDNP